jgi:hypothetical protein
MSCSNPWKSSIPSLSEKVNESFLKTQIEELKDPHSANSTIFLDTEALYKQQRYAKNIVKPP